MPSVVGARRAKGAWLASCVVALIVLGPPASFAQAPTQDGEETREAEIAARQAEKAKALRPPTPNRVEQFLEGLQAGFVDGQIRWHPFFENAYNGGGFTLGAGYARPLGLYSTIDVRGSYTIKNYKRIEAEYLQRRLFDRRGTLAVIGGWREATQVGFYGFGTGNTSHDDRANYSFRQPYGRAQLEVRPTRKALLFTGGVELSQWDQGPGKGGAPSVDEVYTPETLPGLGASPTYLQSYGIVGLDSRPAVDYAKSGGLYKVTFRDFNDRDGQFGFRQVDYEIVQHVPVLRDTWVLSLRGRAELTDKKDGEVIPFFMLPGLGSGSTLRGFSSWRFRDNNSLLLQAEWRVLVNAFLDAAVFYDAGKVAARRGDLDLNGLKSDYGIGFRFHGPSVTPLRIEFARSNEGFVLVFSSSSAF
jgi:hypothetical protein